MKSAGNDIVALQLINRERTCNPAFYSKFVADTELDIYNQPDAAAIPFESFVWLLWSVKESVYKYQQRYNYGLIFSPSKIIIQNIKPSANLKSAQWESSRLGEIFYAGTVLHKSNKLYYCTIIHNEYITTVVNDEENFAGVYWDVQYIDQANNDNQSLAVRSFALNKLESLFPNDTFSFKKSGFGYPILLTGDNQMDIPVSFAHHGHYVAYSFRVDDELNLK